MRTIEYRGTMTALSSIAHGDEDRGTLHRLHRENIRDPHAGKIHHIPVLSGGMIRGALRRVAADMTWHALGAQPLPFRTVDLLRSGGVITATTTKSEVLTPERQAELRRRVPIISLFGGAGGGRVVSGRLVVDKGIPVCKETEWLDRYCGPASGGSPEQFPSIWTLVQRESYSALPDTARVPEQLAEPPVNRANGLMRYAHETFVTGTRFWHSLTIEDAAPLDQAFFADLIGFWSRRAIIGGQKARGMGRVACDYTETVSDVYGDHQDPSGTSLTAEPADWKAHLRDHRDDVLEALAWMH